MFCRERKSDEYENTFSAFARIMWNNKNIVVVLDAFMLFTHSNTKCSFFHFFAFTSRLGRKQVARSVCVFDGRVARWIKTRVRASCEKSLSVNGRIVENTTSRLRGNSHYMKPRIHQSAFKDFILFFSRAIQQIEIVLNRAGKCIWRCLTAD